MGASSRSQSFKGRLAAGQVAVRVQAVGVSALGTQVAGTVDAVAPDSIGFAVRDRVTFRSREVIDSLTLVVDERDLIGIPAAVSFEAAATLFPCALLARTVVKLVHSVGSGTRARVTDRSVVSPFIEGWISQVGATLTRGSADVTITGDSVRAAFEMRPGHGQAQQYAADVFAAVTAGAFDAVVPSTVEEAREGSRAPALIRRSELRVAA